MDDLTYTVLSANFSNPAAAVLNICLPNEDPADRYIFDSSYNISKRRGLFSKTNALLIKMRKTINNDALNSTNQFHRLGINLIPTDGHPDAAAFNKSASEILIIVYHDDSPTTADINLIFGRVNEYYDMVDRDGPYSGTLPKDIPRRVGMSLIKK